MCDDCGVLVVMVMMGSSGDSGGDGVVNGGRVMAFFLFYLYNVGLLRESMG